MNRTLPLLVVLVTWGPAARAQTDHPPLVIALRPAAEPVPALEYRLVPERRALIPGNAATFYHRGIQLVIQRRASDAAVAKPQGKPRQESAEERIANWVSGSISEIPRDEAREKLGRYEAALREAELGAGRSACDWEFDRRTEGIALLLPEIQEMRQLARLVALRARLAILDGQVDEAMHWIGTGLVMGRHVGEGPTLIQALVGIAIENVMLRCLEELIQVPGTPSLYWALADRPRPFIDMRRPMEGERYMLEKELPKLDELDLGVWSVDETRRFAGEMQGKLFTFVADVPIPRNAAAGTGGMPELARRLGIAAIAAKVYPEAKRALVAEGRPEAQVEEMPVVQVALLYSFREYKRTRDNMHKWLNLPYWQSPALGGPSGDLSVEQRLANPFLALFRELEPAVGAARFATVRLERQLDALQCVEAIRLHAAAQGGRLPASLEEIADAPTPLDPATGKPFVYRADGDSATLTAPIPPGAPGHWTSKINLLLKPAR